MSNSMAGRWQMGVYETKEFKDSIKNKVFYEWTAEWLDEHGDIQECQHIDFKEWPVDCSLVDGCVEAKLALKRFFGSEANGLQEVGYAYVSGDGFLEPGFDTGQKVPQRYIEQCERYL